MRRSPSQTNSRPLDLRRVNKAASRSILVICGQRSLACGSGTPGHEVCAERVGALGVCQRTGPSSGSNPPASYIVHTDDGHTWTVGEDELAPLKGRVGKGRRGVSRPVPSSDRGSHGAVALTAEQSAGWGYERPAAAHYRPSSSKGHRGAGWALGFMPLAMLAAQYAITIILAKQLGAAQTHAGSTPSPFVGLASGGGFALLGLAFTVIGPLIVYSATQDAGLTVGFLVVRWIEGYLISFVLTAAVLTSLGLHAGPTVPGAPTPVPGTPTTPGLTRSGRVATPNQSSSQPVSVPNAQGIYMKLNGRMLTVSLGGEDKVGGTLVNEERGIVYLHCIPVRGSGFSLSPQEIRLTATRHRPGAWGTSNATSGRATARSRSLTAVFLRSTRGCACPGSTCCPGHSASNKDQAVGVLGPDEGNRSDRQGLGDQPSTRGSDGNNRIRGTKHDGRLPDRATPRRRTGDRFRSLRRPAVWLPSAPRCLTPLCSPYRRQRDDRSPDRAEKEARDERLPPMVLVGGDARVAGARESRISAIVDNRQGLADVETHCLGLNPRLRIAAAGVALLAHAEAVEEAVMVARIRQGDDAQRGGGMGSDLREICLLWAV